MILFRISLPLLILSLFVGCVKADRGERNEQELNIHSRERSLIAYNNRAQFEVGDIQLEDIKFSDVTESDWKQVDQIQLYFKLCNIRDRASQGTIRNERFHIKSELGSDIMWMRDGERADETNRQSHVYNPITVNSGNCLRWTQQVPVFDFLAPSVNVALHFEIESLSGNLGKVVKRIGFNPWDMYRNQSQSRGFMDLTDFSRDQWYTGQWVTGEDVILALKGELLDSDAELRFKNMVVEPVERERQRTAEYSERLQALSPEERRIRQQIDQQLLQDRSGVHINLNFTGKPVAWVKDSTGIPHQTEIDTGRFTVFMHLVASGAADDSQKHLLSSNVAQITRQNTVFEWSMNADRLLAASVPLLLERRTELGSVELLVRIVPRSAGLNKLKPFSAVFRLGQYDDWVRRQSLNYQFNELYESMDQVNYEEYFNSVIGIEDIDESIMTIRDQKRFYFKPLKMRFVRIMPGESATDRTLQYSVTTCVENWRGAAVGRGYQFNVVTEDQNRERVMRRETNEDGCLTWFGTLSHKYYRREVLEQRTAKVTYVGTRNNGNSTTFIEGGDRAGTVLENVNQNDAGDIINQYEERFTYYMNPWDEKWTFGWDEPDMPANYYNDIIEQRRNAPKSQLFIADFRYETMGFRYAIDKYLNLKVKKAVLLKAYPYVLKYNSIVRGRLGTEKLRDGVYLMKVALQKDYLDPSAKGVRIYDEELEQPYEIASDPNLVEFDPENPPTNINDIYDQITQPGDGGGPDQLLGEGQYVNARMTWNPNDSDERGAHVNHRLLNETELKEAQKEYISVQTKLVRVMGGMIITPIEFEIDDLRLMRIRNQFFIQLQTIDEHRLRVATAIDRAIHDLFPDMENSDDPNHVVNRYNEVFTQMDELYALQEDSERVKGILNFVEETERRIEAEDQLVEIEGNITQARRKLYDMLGLGEFSEGTEAFQQRLQAIQARLERLEQYRQLLRERGLPYLTEFRNDKRELINRILNQMDQQNDYNTDEAAAAATDENRQAEGAEAAELNDTDNEEAISDDPFLKFLFIGSHFDGRTQSMTDLVENELGVNIDELKYADFTESSLNPAFDFDLLLNDGVHNPDAEVDDGHSGLPSRTFVGPLTFVFNTNGSSLRPVNILNENYCRTAYCEEPERIMLEDYDPNTVEGKIQWGIPPEQVEVTNKVNENFQLEELTEQPIYESGDSVNANYENNEYYGYLKAYHGVTVDQLIERKKQVEEKNIRKMEEASQIVNFVKSMGLNYTLLSDNPKSRLKGIDHDCAQTIEIDRIDECFNDITDGPDILKADSLFRQLNERGDNAIGHEFTESIQNTWDNVDYYNAAGRDPITPQDLKDVMTLGWRNESLEPDLARKLMHRMCYVLTQSFFKGKYFDRPISLGERVTTLTQHGMNKRSLYHFEKHCHRMIGQMYGYYREGTTRRYEQRFITGKALQDGLRPKNNVAFSPVILERKVRAYGTTGRYVYRGGKSLNINLTTSFNLSSSNGLKTSTTASFKPWEWVFGTVGAIAGGVAGFFSGGPPGIFIGATAVGTATKQMTGAFSVSRANSRDESAGRTQGTNVSSGTFLVSQQATFDIELGEYERCLVARLHPLLIKSFFELGDADSHPYLKNAFVGEDRDLNQNGVIEEHLGEEYSDIAKQGVLICTGEPIRDRTLPVKEKYYYFTQHFTEGDMLDTADLHNHPWLLQLRGYRDFQAFTSTIGAREVNYVDSDRWVNDVMAKTASDAAAMQLQGSQVDNLKPELEIVRQNSDINWPLEELSRTYFEVLPTFPGLYTYMNESGENVEEWPYDNTDPGRSFETQDE